MTTVLDPRRKSSPRFCLDVQVAVIQRRLSPFRIPVFNRLATEPGIALTVFADTAPPEDVELQFQYKRVRGRTISCGGRQFVVHPRVLRKAARHDVIVLEGSLRVLTSVALIATKPLHKVPLVWWTSLYDPKCGRISMPAGAKALALRLILRRVDAVVAYSTVAAELLRAAMPGAQIFTAPNVLDTEALDRAERSWLRSPESLNDFATSRGFKGRSVILFVGRLITTKAVDDLVRAFARVRSRGPHAPLLAIVGDGAHRSSLEALVERLGLSQDVRFFGEIRDPREVCPFFLSSKVLVLPAAGGLALYQSLAHGLPAVATRADGTERDLIRDGETGFLCERGDIDALSSRILRVLELPAEQWAELSGRCRRLARDELSSRHMVAGLRSAVDAARRVSSTSPKRQRLRAAEPTGRV